MVILTSLCVPICLISLDSALQSLIEQGKKLFTSMFPLFQDLVMGWHSAVLPFTLVLSKTTNHPAVFSKTLLLSNRPNDAEMATLFHSPPQQCRGFNFSCCGFHSFCLVILPHQVHGVQPRLCLEILILLNQSRRTALAAFLKERA